MYNIVFSLIDTILDINNIHSLLMRGKLIKLTIEKVHDF